ncbi:hypothetical protein CONPUDRAFT_153663 [Coniophora puteana RWD-64-598 SS2]|uniref:Uncharacterized protein n=1 Tax=Coniophora puteana (strain RWD-64-598) TaxID=741705 RepID=A0A5M3MPR0_CONPW|nr:uncharacterized protein CONPUDRAFT_153663 [Coniophora puteana RWD-64-598 SS2]EIW81113.1 hypothetical protein CONPUDRAFT_153663 [Coniophora puteana RWD-64-598 SS2]
MRFFALSAAIIAIVAPVLAAPTPFAPQGAHVARDDIKSEISTLINDAQSSGLINSTEAGQLEQIVNLVNPQDMQMLLGAIQTDLQGFLSMLSSSTQASKRDAASDLDSLIQQAQSAGILSQQAASVLEGIVAAGEAAAPEIEAIINQLKGQLQAAGVSKRDNWVTKIETDAAQAVSLGIISQTTADGIDAAALMAENDTAKLEQIYNEVVGYLQAAGITPSAKRTDWVSMVEDVTAQALAAGLINQAESDFIDGVATSASTDATKLQGLYNQVVSYLKAAGIVPSARDSNPAQDLETLINDAVNAGVLTQQDAQVFDSLINSFSSSQIENLINQLKSQLGLQRRHIPFPTLGPHPPFPSNLPPFPTLGPVPQVPKNKRVMPLEPLPPSSGEPKWAPGPVVVADVEARHIPFPTLGPIPTLPSDLPPHPTLPPTPTLGPHPSGSITLPPVPTLGPTPTLPGRAVDLD